jgi:predicted nucleic acid-binding protein
LTYLLDTNVVSEFRKVADGRSDPRVAAWQARIPAEQFFLSTIVLLELELGTLLMERRNRSQGQMLREWLDLSVLPTFADRILPVDARIALRCARMHVPNRQPEGDALIAATALVHGMIIVSRNVADFAPMGVRTINPWQA